jgi:hypothetical protein
MRATLARAHRALADLFTLFLLPGFIALLPWAVGFRLLRGVARSESLYRLAADPAWDAARRHVHEIDEHEFKFRFRLLRLVDHADVYLTLLRGAGWRQRHVEISGALPSTTAKVFLTYHWGTGNWIWPLLHERGVHAHFLARRAQGRALGHTRLSHSFGRFRAWALARIGSAGPLFTGRSADEIARALHEGRSVVGMLDLPAQRDQSAAAVTLLGARALFPQGLAALAQSTNVPIALFSFGLDFDSGRRHLHVEALPAGLAQEEVMRRYAEHLDARLREQPAAWQIWREAPAIFVAERDASAGAQGLE